MPWQGGRALITKMDASFMQMLREIFEQIQVAKEEGFLFSLYLKAAMMRGFGSAAGGWVAVAALPELWLREGQAQAVAFDPVTEWLLHGSQVPLRPADHHRLQPCPDCRALWQLQRDALSAHRGSLLGYTDEALMSTWRR